MNRISIVTGWTGAGTDLSPWMPALLQDHPLQPGESYQAAEPGDPDAPDGTGDYPIYLTCTDATLEALRADDRYLILWEEAL